MAVLLLAATGAEIAPLLPMREKAVEVLIGGVGILSTAYALTRALSERRYERVIQAGIGGSFRADWPLGTVVEVVADCVADLGAEDRDGRFLDMSALGLGEVSWMVNPAPLNWAGIPQTAGITVNKVHGSAASISQARALYPDAGVESMEGAAAFFVCLREGIPFVQLRSISNYVEPRNRAAWEVGLAIRELCEAVGGVLGK